MELVKYGDAVLDQLRSGAVLLQSSVKDGNFVEATRHFIKKVIYGMKKNDSRRVALYVVIISLIWKVFFSGSEELQKKNQVRKVKGNNCTDLIFLSSDDDGFSVEDGIPVTKPNEIIETDEVVVVNRNNKYVEVYRKSSCSSLSFSGVSF